MLTNLEEITPAIRFYGALDYPTPNSTISRKLTVAGWFFSSVGLVKSVEVWLGDNLLGKVDYGSERPDVRQVFGPDVPLNCGFIGIFNINLALVKTGPQELLFKALDEQGNKCLITQPVTLEALPPLDAYKPLLTEQYLSILQEFLASNAHFNFPVPDAPLVSILLVLYNRAELTYQCLNSLSKIQDVPFEIIIVDNHSTDATNSLLERVAGATIIRNSDNLNFLLGSNQAARAAKGKYLLFLNNDTQLLPTSLDSAIKTIESAGDIGAVGGKIILLDGTLQEAGSVVWRDGSCAGYGRGDSPSAPMYNFQRNVDYCSGAFLLTSRELFLELGCFDEAYRPAYYEEVDYCLKLWEMGKRVVYDPKAILLHFEFASSKSSEAALQLQINNRDTLKRKNARQLQYRRPPGLENMLDARATIGNWPRILFIEDRPPHAYMGSGFPRSRQMLLGLLELNCFVTFYPTHDIEENWNKIYQDIPKTVEVMQGYKIEGLEDFLHKRKGYYDIIIISRPHNMQRFQSIFQRNREWFGNTKIVYDAEALFSLREIAQRQLNGFPLSEKETDALLKEEIGLAAEVDTVLCVSPVEQALFTAAGLKQTLLLKHCIDIEPTENSFEERDGILFVGAFHNDTSPNANAAFWFSGQIWPRITQKLGADLEFRVAGLNYSRKISRLSDTGVKVLGRIDDLRPLYNQSRIFIAPNRFAAGIPLKIIEAVAYGMPVVATSLLAKQLGWEAGQELLVADSAAEFAEKCIQLLTDPKLWECIRAKALARVQADYSKAAFMANLTEIVYE